MRTVAGETKSIVGTDPRRAGSAWVFFDAFMAGDIKAYTTVDPCATVDHPRDPGPLLYDIF